MNNNLCCLYPAYGAMVKALPRNAAQLDGMAEELLVQAVIPFFKQPQAAPVTAQQFNQWFNNLNGLEGLDDLDGFKKKLKKVAKTVAKAHVKVLKAPAKLAKKAAKSKVIKKIARPLAYAVGAATGTIGLVAKADQIRSAARKAKAKLKTTANEYGLNTETEQPQQAQADSQEPVQPVDFGQSFAPMSQSFMPSTPPNYSSIPPIPQAAPVTRLEQPQNDEGRIVGVNGGAIMDSIKANPLPWAIGAGALILLVARK